MGKSHITILPWRWRKHLCGLLLPTGPDTVYSFTMDVTSRCLYLYTLKSLSLSALW